MSYKIMGCRIILFCVFYAYYNYKENYLGIKYIKGIYILEQDA